VVAVDVDAARGRVLADEIDGLFIAADVGDPKAWTVIVGETTEAFGGIDWAHLNAGVPVGAYPVHIQGITDEQYLRALGVNANGVFYGIRALVPSMERRGGGAIVATSSVAGLCPLPQDPVYAATKHFVIGLVRSLAEPLAQQHVAINAICPGGVDTPLVDSIGQRGDIATSGRQLMGAEQVAIVVTEMFGGTETGQVYTVLQTNGSVRFDFPEIPGLQR
jgi:NAD(P)-dependent dehydrogenase (short-subunit alcohol dehydrogenase family)